MRAITFHGIEDVRCETVDDPRVEAPGEVVVRVAAAGICGSDLHVYHGRETGLDAGTVLGHEFVGEVVERGPGVELEVGARVIGPFTTSCGRCFYCTRGLTSRCARGQLFGWVEQGEGLHGAQAELVRVPLADSTLARWPDGLAAELALLAGDVLATGYFCADAAAFDSGAVVAVVGCGPVGLMAVIAARELEARRVLALDSVPERHGLAQRLGGEPVDVARPGARERVLTATEGRGVDAVLEAVGSSGATRLAIDLVRPGGTVSAVGVHTEVGFPFAPAEAYDKNLTYRLGRCPARRYLDRVLPLLVEGRYDFGAIVSHRLPLADGTRGYEIFAGKLDGCTKVVLEPGRDQSIAAGAGASAAAGGGPGAGL